MPCFIWKNSRVPCVASPNATMRASPIAFFQRFHVIEAVTGLDGLQWDCVLAHPVHGRLSRSRVGTGIARLPGKRDENSDNREST